MSSGPSGGPESVTPKRALHLAQPGPHDRQDPRRPGRRPPDDHPAPVPVLPRPARFRAGFSPPASAQVEAILGLRDAGRGPGRARRFGGGPGDRGGPGRPPAPGMGPRRTWVSAAMLCRPTPGPRTRACRRRRRGLPRRSGAALVAERLVDLDEGVQERRYRHVKMVRWTIGTKRGTGGLSGVEYLRVMLFQPAFPDLWRSVRALSVPRPGAEPSTATCGPRRSCRFPGSPRAPALAVNWQENLAPGSVAIGIWVGVAMHDLPLAVLAPTDRRDSQLIRLGIFAADRNGGMLDADDVTQVRPLAPAASTSYSYVPFRELRLQPVEQLTAARPSRSRFAQPRTVSPDRCATTRPFAGRVAVVKRGVRFGQTRQHGRQERFRRLTSPPPLVPAHGGNEVVRFWVDGILRYMQTVLNTVRMYPMKGGSQPAILLDTASRTGR